MDQPHSGLVVVGVVETEAAQEAVLAAMAAVALDQPRELELLELPIQAVVAVEAQMQ
jgi:hypothetical protein